MLLLSPLLLLLLLSPQKGRRREGAPKLRLPSLLLLQRLLKVPLLLFQRRRTGSSCLSRRHRTWIRTAPLELS